MTPHVRGAEGRPDPVTPYGCATPRRVTTSPVNLQLDKASRLLATAMHLRAASSDGLFQLLATLMG